MEKYGSKMKAKGQYYINHPNKKVLCKGLCRGCYEKQRKEVSSRGS